jgi:hypothetical protein
MMKNGHGFIAVLPFANLERTFKTKADKEKFNGKHLSSIHELIMDSRMLLAGMITI